MDRDGSGLSIHALASPEPETTAEQPAPVSTKAPGTRDHCRATGPRVYKSSLTWIHRGQPALEFGQVFLPETAAGQPAPASTKAVPKLDHQGTTSRAGIQISPFRFIKKNYPSRHALRNQGHHLGLTKATGHRVRTGAPAQPEGERTNTWDLRRQPALVSAQKLHLNQRAKPQKTNETFNTGRTPDHVTSKLEKKP